MIIHDLFVPLAMLVSGGDAPSTMRVSDPVVRTAEREPDRALFGSYIVIDMNGRSSQMGPFSGQPIYCSGGGVNCISTVFGTFAGPQTCGHYSFTKPLVNLRRLGKVRWHTGLNRRWADVLYIKGQNHAVWLFDDQHGLVGISIAADFRDILSPLKYASQRNQLQQAMDAMKFDFKGYAETFLPCN